MKTKLFVFAQFFLCCSMAFGQITVEVESTNYQVKDLVVVTIKGAADSLRLKIFDSKYQRVDKKYELVAGNADEQAFLWQPLSNGNFLVEASDSIGDAIAVIQVGGENPEPNPNPGPQPPPGPNLKGLALEIYNAAMKVQSPTRSADAKKMADIFRSVRSQAAGLATMTPEQIDDLTSASIQRAFDETTTANWRPWRLAWIDILTRDFKRATRDQIMDGWEQVAIGLEAVK